MTQRTTATLFSGFEGFGVGARAAGYRHLWGVEWSARIAGVADRNGFASIVANVCNVDYATLEAPYHLHGSPVCKNASIAKTDKGETEEDRETARATVRAFETLRPVVFTLENVRGYLHFDSFKKIIVPALKCAGYGVTYDVLNSADYGVPQTRERLILRAVQGQDRPLLPIATHARRDKLTPLFDDRLPWVGWLEAVADLIDTLPASEFAPWQLKRLPAEIKSALIMDSANQNSGSYRLEQEPFITVETFSKSAYPRAFVLDGQANGHGASVTMRHADEPLYTVSTDSGTKRTARAYLATGLKHTRKEEVTIRAEHEPSTTLLTGYRPNWIDRAVLAGHVVKMTPRALARFQTFPDTYWLPDQASLACEGIGNAVPCLLAQRLCEVE